MVKNIFDTKTFDEIISRVNSLNPNSQRLWGKMTVSQMLAHLVAALKVVTEYMPPPRMMAGKLIGWALKKKVYDNSPIKKNMPTAPTFLIKEDKEIDKEKAELFNQLGLLIKKGPVGVHNITHPFFGKLTGEQWGLGIWKHINHHLKQFGV